MRNVKDMNGDGLTVIRKGAFALFMILALFLSGCEWKFDKVIDETNYKENTYFSVLSKEECYLCGDKNKNLHSDFWGKNKVALISLNTFEMMPIRIPLDPNEDECIEDNFGYVILRGFCNENDGFVADIIEVPDRRYARASISFNEDELLKADKASDFLCTDCFNKVLYRNSGDSCLGVGMVNLYTGELRLFTDSLAGFTLGDFYIDCDFKPRDKDGALKLDVLIFYCPVQYKE